MSVSITAAGAGDAEQIIKLQYLCYQQEAGLYGDYSIDPLTQTLESLREELSTGHALRGSLDGTGSARIERLIVHPRMQGHGLGGRLLKAMEARLLADKPEITAFRLTAGHRSEVALRLYQHFGYTPVSVREVNRRLKIVTMEKPLRDAEEKPLAATA
jgi:ribosomal protein S18 acetylase RimI-like enzyme